MFSLINEEPEYELLLISKKIDTNEEYIMEKIEEDLETTYKFYTVTLDGEEKAIVASLEESEKMVAELSEMYEDKLEPKIGVTELITTDNIKEDVTKIDDAKNDIETILIAQVKEIEAAEAKAAAEARAIAEALAKQSASNVVSLNGVALTVKPVSGTITSRFGSFESIRSNAHKGLDIAAPKGTPIYAAAGGTVTYAGYHSSYGYMVKISHGSSIVTLYAHASQLFVSVGQKVSAGQHIAAVGTTGRSTGNHLHFEVQKNGVQLNPQNYLY